MKVFCSLSLLDQLHVLSTCYYKLKGIVFYRVVFKQFGRGSFIRKPLLIANPGFINIGKGVAIREGARLEVVRSNPDIVPELTIGDDTNIEQNVHIVCHCRMCVGSNVSITANCSIVDVTHPYWNVKDPEKIGARILNEASFVEVGDGAFIGFGSVILPNVRIGKYAVIGANSVVTSDIPDYSVAVGAPAVVVKQYDFARESWVRVVSCRTAQVGER